METTKVPMASIQEANALTNQGLRVSGLEVHIENERPALMLRIYYPVGPAEEMKDLVLSISAAWQLYRALKKAVKGYLRG